MAASGSGDVTVGVDDQQAENLKKQRALLTTVVLDLGNNVRLSSNCFYRIHLLRFFAVTVTTILFAPFSVQAESDSSGLVVSGLSQVDYFIGDHSGDLADKLRLRRLRVGVAGDLANHVSYKAKFDIDERGDFDVLDAYAELSFNKVGARLLLGQHKTPNSLDELTSSSSLSTLERAAFTDAMELDRGFGASLYFERENFTVAAGLFGGNINGSDVFDQFTAAGRIAYFRSINEKAEIHIGGSWRHRRWNDDHPLQYRASSFDRSGQDLIANRGLARQDRFFGAEAAIRNNRVWLAGEFAHASQGCAATVPCEGPRRLRGGYGEAGIAIWGERHYHGGHFRNYEIHRSVTEGGVGALVLAYRFDVLGFDAPSADYNAHIVSVHWSPLNAIRASVSGFQEKSLCRPSGFISCSDVAFSDTQTRRGAVFRIQAGFSFDPL